MLNGIDVSDDQGTIDFGQVRNDPHGQFVFAQATGGLTVTNTTFRANHDGAKDNGIPFGAYHFFYAKDPGDQQAQHFLNFIDGYEGTLLPMVDVEQDSLAGFTGGPGDVIAALIAFDTKVRASLPAGKLPIIYFGYSFWSNYLGGSSDFSGHPAWPAAYNPDPSLSMNGTGWASWTLWQYADNGSVAGVPTNVDLDRLTSLNAILRTSGA
jgi:lysozyme